MARSSSKLPYIHHSLLKKITQLKNQVAAGEKVTKKIRTWSRSSVVIEAMIGIILEIHNGRGFKDVPINPQHVGLKLGALAPTRKAGPHPVKKKDEGKDNKKGAK